MGFFSGLFRNSRAALRKHDAECDVFQRAIVDGTRRSFYVAYQQGSHGDGIMRAYDKTTGKWYGFVMVDGTEMNVVELDPERF